LPVAGDRFMSETEKVKVNVPWKDHRQDMTKWRQTAGKIKNKKTLDIF